MTSPKDEDKSETDVDDDNKVAGSRAGKEGDEGDGSYVGRTFNDDALDDEVSGAEARSQQGDS
ncbi:MULTISPECIES: hypothetical protein [Mycobacteriaceae]|uniref:Uncharacterized protein n=2 Tax=Mycolicibacterium TaxID=1866885 RepID=A0A9X2YTH8_9MYCO|nr:MULTISPECIES: hypothetical protein [Mycolicibacterium]MCV7172332.1 hypothetical protein [[Mycobacterium] manitobense]MDO3638639.1 hypothetical protein [Mycolicibacterium arseniciresistens]